MPTLYTCPYSAGKYCLLLIRANALAAYLQGLAYTVSIMSLFLALIVAVFVFFSICIGLQSLPIISWQVGIVAFGFAIITGWLSFSLLRNVGIKECPPCKERIP